MPHITRQLAAIMFTDIVGYTALMGEDEAKAFDLLEKNRILQKPLIDSYGGKWIKELGDGVLATFSTVSDAVYCAVAIQKASKREPDLNLRIGIHQGEVVFQDDDVFGDGVNIASRLESLAPSGGIWLSEAVYRNIQNKHGLQALFVGEEQLKNVIDPIKIYEINAVDVELPELEEPSQGKPTTKSSSTNKPVYLTLAVIVIALLSYWGYRQFYNSPSAEVEDITIAVLAFDDQSPEGDQEYLGNGIASEIINLLGKVNGLNVIGKASSFSFKDKDATIEEIGQVLNADMVVDGSIIVVDNITRISVQLIDVSSSKQVWSENYDRQEANLLAIIDGAAQSIASSLSITLSFNELEGIKVVNEIDPEAFEYYLKGINIHWDKVVNTNWGDDNSLTFYFDQAQNMFLKAISINHNYVDAYAGLADLYQSMGGDYLEKRDSVLKIGYSINPNSAYILATIASGLDRALMDSSFYLLKKAHNVESTNTIINTAIMNQYGNIGLYDNAISQANKIIMHDPLNMYVRRRLITFLMRNGNIEKARSECDDILNIDANNLDGLAWKGIIALFIDNNNVESRRLFEKVQNLSGITELLHPLMLAMDGEREALNLRKSSQIYSLLNMKKEAIDWVDSISSLREFTSGFTYPNLKHGHAYAFIRDEPRFKEILANAKKVHEERVSKYGHLFDE